MLFQRKTNLRVPSASTPMNPRIDIKAGAHRRDTEAGGGTGVWPLKKLYGAQMRTKSDRPPRQIQDRSRFNSSRGGDRKEGGGQRGYGRVGKAPRPCLK